MSEARYLLSVPDLARAEAHLQDSFEGSPLAQVLATQFPGQGTITLVTASEPPSGLDYFEDWGSLSCTDWLTSEIIDYLRQSSCSVVLFEDIVSSPSDPFHSAQGRPSCWCDQNRVFWPVLPEGVTQHTVEQVMAWSAALRIHVAFSTLPGDFHPPAGDYTVPHHIFSHIASSLTRLVVDVFDGGGYMVWERQD